MSSDIPADTSLSDAPKVSAFKAAISSFAYTAPTPTTRKRARSPEAALTSPSPRRITRSTSQSLLSSAPTASPISGSSRSPRPSPAKRASPSKFSRPSLKSKKPSGYAPPSRYAHLPNLLTDALSPGLICVFIGVNPGLKTATTGHAYAHPSNLFWKLLHSSGCTPRRCAPSETYALPQIYGLGNTNIVARATANAAELSKQEMDEGVAVLERKVRECRPESVAIVGKGIWESIWRVRYGRQIKKEEFRYGWQDERENMGRLNGDGHGQEENEDDTWNGARVFVATSTSGLAAGLRPPEKEAIWRELGEFVEKRREEKGLVGDRRLVDGTLVEGYDTIE